MPTPFVVDPDDPDITPDGRPIHHYYGNIDSEQDAVIAKVNAKYIVPTDMTASDADTTILKYTQLKSDGKVDRVYERQNGRLVDVTERYLAEQQVLETKLAYEKQLKRLALQAKKLTQSKIVGGIDEHT